MAETTLTPRHLSERFDLFPLVPKLRCAVAESRYTAMAANQAKSIVLAGRDVMCAAQTGAAKTAAFTLQLLLQKMLRHENGSMSPARHPVRALVLAPTRELADHMANSYLQDPVLVEVARPNATATIVEQRFYSVADEDKRAVEMWIVYHAPAEGATLVTNDTGEWARIDGLVAFENRVRPQPTG